MVSISHLRTFMSVRLRLQAPLIRTDGFKAKTSCSQVVTTSPHAAFCVSGWRATTLTSVFGCNRGRTQSSSSDLGDTKIWWVVSPKIGVSGSNHQVKLDKKRNII